MVRSGDVGGGHGYFDVESSAAAGSGGELGAVDLCDGPHDGQSESVTAAAVPLLTGLPERLEQLLDVFGGDDRAGVADREAGGAVENVGADGEQPVGNVVD